MEKITYKATLRIPMDTYAYIEIQVEGEPQEIVSLYRKFSELKTKKESALDKKIAEGAEYVVIEPPIINKSE